MPVLVTNLAGERLDFWRFGPDSPASLLKRLELDANKGLLAADFDQDGDTDLLVHLHTDDSLHILENTGGAFVQGPATTIHRFATILSVFDINADGLPDLIITDWSRSFQILLNTGDGTFTETAEYSMNDNPMQVLPADLNLDGLQDMLVQQDRSNIIAFLQQPDGQFRRVTPEYPRGHDELMLAGDINGDGLTDIVYPNRGVFLNQGDAIFTPGLELDFRVRHIIKLGDLDNDGDLDLIANVFHSPIQETARSLLNNGAGEFILMEDLDTLAVTTIRPTPSSTTWTTTAISTSSPNARAKSTCASAGATVPSTTLDSQNSSTGQSAESRSQTSTTTATSMRDAVRRRMHQRTRFACRRPQWGRGGRCART